MPNCWWDCYIINISGNNVLASIKRLKNLVILFIEHFTFRNYLEEVIMLAQNYNNKEICYCIISYFCYNNPNV